MRIIISPAKKMNVEDTLAWHTLPQFLSDAEQICAVLRTMDYAALRAVWKCNDKLATQNFARVQTMSLRTPHTPALLSYDGIQYRSMAPHVMTDRQLAYLSDHLRMISGLYGLLRPFDGVVPYRLEMQAALRIGEHDNLYRFWGDRLARALTEQTDCIVNLASKEYSRCIAPYVPQGVRWITCVFGERKGDKIIEKATLCKMARGEMVRLMAEEQVSDPDALCTLAPLGYHFSASHSTRDTLVFVR